MLQSLQTEIVLPELRSIAADLPEQQYENSFDCNSILGEPSLDHLDLKIVGGLLVCVFIGLLLGAFVWHYEDRMNRTTRPAQRVTCRQLNLKNLKRKTD